jgi:hypothetical protein
MLNLDTQANDELEHKFVELHDDNATLYSRQHILEFYLLNHTGLQVRIEDSCGRKSSY